MEGTVNSAMGVATIQLFTEESKVLFYVSGFVVQKDDVSIPTS